MCGRYHLGIKTDNKLAKQISERAQKLNLVYSTGEIFPSNKVLCIIPNESKVDLSVMKWGIKSRSLIINARVESITDRPTFNEIRNNRCAIICDSFYEWDKDKNKYQISFESDYVYLACIFNRQNELVILTRQASEDFKHIHSRMPIIMDKEEMLNYVHNKEDMFIDKKLFINKVDGELSLF